MTATPRTALLAAAVALAAACSRPEELPDMGVSRTTLSFQAPGGSGEPAAQTVYVVNTGRGSLAGPAVGIAYDDGAGWLAATVAGSGAPYTVLVQPTVGALAPGSYGATLTISCGNASSSPVQVHVTLTVPDPRFTVSVPSLSFEAPRGGGDPAPQTFQVLNAGRGTLPVPEIGISYVGPTGWLVAAVSGTPDAYSVTVTAHVAGMYSGAFTATMSVGAAGGEGPPRTLAVTLTIPTAEIALSGGDVRIDGPADGTDPAPVSLTVANAGGGVLAPPSATIAYAPGWTGPAWLDATLSGDGAPYTLTLQARQSRETTSLEGGTHLATVTVASPNAANSPQTLTVTLVVPPTSMHLSASVDSDDPVSSVAFSGIAGCPVPPPSPPRIIVTNGGPGTLAPPTASVPPEMSAWLEVAVTGDRAPYVVTFAMKALPGPADVRSGDVVLESPGAAAAASVRVSYSEQQYTSPRIVSVTRPSYPLLFSAQDGAGDPGSQTIRFDTAGGCVPPDVSVSYPAGATPWIATQVVSGFLRHDVVLAASTAGMAPGDSRTADVVVTFPWGDAWTVPVVLRLGALVATGPMDLPRAGHTMTVLPLGNVDFVIVTGGWTYGGPPPAITASAERYHPELGTWAAVSSLGKPRYLHGAALIDNAWILVCGGYTGPNVIDQSLDASCEVMFLGYPWRDAATLRVARRSPSVVPLEDGSVLVASAEGPPEILRRVTGPGQGPSWSSTLVEGVAAESAVKLADGRVLTTAVWSATLYDPVRDAWTPTGSMRARRSHPTLVPLPDGRVLAVGGLWDFEPNSAEIWDPATGTWTLTAAPSSAHDPAMTRPPSTSDTIALSNGKVISVAGILRNYAGYPIPGDDVEMFDPATETWSVVARFPTARVGVVPVRLTSGMVLMAGGQQNVDPMTGGGYFFFDEAFTW